MSAAISVTPPEATLAVIPVSRFGALRVDEAVGLEIVRLLQPLGVEAAIQAIRQCEHEKPDSA